MVSQLYYCHYISTIQNQLQSFPQILPLDNFLNRLNPAPVAPSIILLPEEFHSAGPLLQENGARLFCASIPAELQPHLVNTLAKQSSQSIPSRTNPVSPGFGPHHERKSPHPQMWTHCTT